MRSSGSDVLQVVLVVSAVLGLVAAVYTLVTAWTGRRDRRAINKVIDTAERTLVAEDAERDVDEIQALRDVLRREVQDEIPLEARRVYLRARLEELRSQLGADVREFERLQQELASLDSGSNPLDASLRATIEDSIRPAYVRRRQAERALGGVLGLLVLAIFFPLGTLPLDAWDSIVYSASSTTVNVTASIAVAAGLLCLGLVLSARAVPGRFRRTRSTRLLRGAAVGLTALAIVMLTVGVAVSNHATAVLINFDNFPFGDSSTSPELLQSRYLGAQQAAAWLLGGGTIALGAGAALWVDVVRLRRQRQRVRRRSGRPAVPSG